jgi:exosortase
MTDTSPGKRSAIFIGVAVAAVALVAYLPNLRWLVVSWLSCDYYSHGPLVVLASAACVWMKRKYLRRSRSSPWALVAFAVAVASYAVATIFGIKSMVAVSLVVFLTAAVLAVLGDISARELSFPLGFLLFAIPFPFAIDLAFRLQLLSVTWSSFLLRMVGLPVTVSGSEINLGGVVFSVGVACSGINTLVALLALAAFYSFLLTGSLLKRSFLVVLAFPLAIAGNVLRVGSVILMANAFGLGPATGWYHTVSSPLLFGLEFLLLVVVGHALGCRINYERFRV